MTQLNCIVWGGDDTSGRNFGPSESGNPFLFTGSGYLFQTRTLKR